MRAINRLVWFKILRGFHIENPDPAYLHAPDRYRCGFLEEQVLFDCAKREDYELSEAFLRSALGKGDECFGNGNWIQHPPDLDDQWALFCHYGSLRPLESYWLAPGGMVLITPKGERRLLGHPYNTSANYTLYTFAKFSSDGRYVLFTSDMDGSGRSDLFLAELPAR